jgi:predicted nucleic acid-binding protein
MGIKNQEGCLRMGTVVCDTGPILHLREAGSLDLLSKIGRVFIPRMVDIELTELDDSWKSQRPSWISVETLSGTESSQAEVIHNSGLLNAGESETIILAQRLKVDWLLTDDTAARVFANAMGLEVHGSLGLVLWAAAIGYLQYAEAKSAIDRLVQSSLWISQTVLEKACKALDEICG